MTGAPLQVLTVRQPWATAILELGKDVENRTWTVRHRGPLVIHAAATSSRAAVHRALASGYFAAGPPARPLPTGSLLGVAQLVDVHSDTHCLDRHGPSRCSPWAMPGHHHWQLASPRTYATAVPAGGRLGLWRLDPDTAVELLPTHQEDPMATASTSTDPQGVCDAFNATHPVGTPVRYWPGVREGAGRDSRTRSRAWVIGGHSAVVSVDGHAGGIALTHVQPADAHTGGEAHA